MIPRLFSLLTGPAVKVSMENVRLIKPSPESINNVVLANPDALQTLRALSARQNAGLRSWSADFIEGKGAGQIVLLHGKPFRTDYTTQANEFARPSWGRENLYSW